MANKRRIPIGILLFAIYQFFHSLTLIFSGLNSLLEISSVPNIAKIGTEADSEIVIILQIITIIIGIWGLSLAINLFKLNDKARRRLILYSKIILIFSLVLFILGAFGMIIIAIISLIIIKYLNSRKVKRAFGVSNQSGA